MKKLSILTILGALAIASCTDIDFDSSRAELIKGNAENVLGIIDPNQDWSSISSGTITITADAPLYNIEKVQILTGSPFFNSEASVLAEAETSKGGIVTLSYDAPNIYSSLVAVCIDDKGHQYIKSFNIGEDALSFKSSTSASTRAVTRAEGDYPEANKLKLEFKNAVLSYNTQRANFVNEAYGTNEPTMLDVVTKGGIGQWKDSGWDDMLWYPNNATSGSWTVSEGSIHRDAIAMTEEEEQTLKTIFGDFLTRDGSGTWGRKNNLEIIRESKSVKFYNNELTSDGSTPITITPIWMPSSEINTCHLYYYYYSPSDVPSNMSEADYVKTLPKFKAIQCSQALNKAKNGTDFAKGYEYLLPYYGEPSAFQPSIINTSSFSTTDGKIYRIRCGGQRYDEDYYMVYTGTDSKKLATKYADDASNVAMQLWQVFTTTNGYKMLYNIGASKFLTFSGYWDTPYSVLSNVKNAVFRFDENNRIWRYNDKNKALGTNWDNASKLNNMNIQSDKNANSGVYSQWYFEEFTGSGISTVENVELKEYPSTIIASDVVIPAGYKIGLMLRKMKDTGPFVTDYRDITDCGHGCCYGFGSLNREINNLPGHFGSGVELFTMQEDDPRAAIFNANGKTYIAFEDGSDAQYNDIVIEVGGYDKTVLAEAPDGTEEKGSGIQTDYLYDENEIEGIAYSLCFEDRPIEADYDLNDVVLRCKRKTGSYRDYVDLSLVAAGRNDHTAVPQPD